MPAISPLRRYVIAVVFLAACDATESIGPLPEDTQKDESALEWRPSGSVAVQRAAGIVRIEPSVDMASPSRPPSIALTEVRPPDHPWARGSVAVPGVNTNSVDPEGPSLVWHGSASGYATLLRMTGTTWSGETAVPFGLPAPWRLASAADMNKDGHPDLLWENTSDGTRAVVFMHGTVYSGHYTILGNVSPSLRLAGSVDMNADGNPDLIWSNDSNGDHSVWFMDGATYTNDNAVLPNLGPTWKLVTFGDFNGDARADMVWEQTDSGLRAVTFMNGSVYSGNYTIFAAVDTSWHIRAAADFNGDNETDLVWQNSANGYRLVTFMDGAFWNGSFASIGVVGTSENIVAAAPVQWGKARTALLRLVTFGDSNTDLGYLGVDPLYKAAAYVSNAPDPYTPVRLGPDDSNHPLQLAGKVEVRWRAARSEFVQVVNHSIVATTTGTGRTFRSSPNALEQVGGITRFEGEVLGRGYPWSGGETASPAFPNGAVARVQAFSPKASDFVYVSLGTNDIIQMPVAAILANLETMVTMWTSAGLPANHFIITTLPPREPENSALLPSLNAGIRALATSRGLSLIDLAGFTSADDGKTWLRSSLHVSGNPLHFAEEVRDWTADQILEILSGS